MQPGDLVKVKLRIPPPDWTNKEPMIGVLLKRWSEELLISEYDFFGDIDDEMVIEIEEPYWEVKLANGKKDYFKENELEKIA